MGITTDWVVVVVAAMMLLVVRYLGSWYQFGPDKTPGCISINSYNRIHYFSCLVVVFT